MKIAWSDGGRHRRESGYGHASRVLLKSLMSLGKAEFFLLGPQPNWEHDHADCKELVSLPVISNELECDFAIQVGTPETTKALSIPSALYTFLDVSGPTVQQEKILRTQSFLIAPNYSILTDYASRGIRSVIFQPNVDTVNFRPQPRWREEGEPVTSFVFVGTHSFRKGTDILLEAFVRAFPQSNAHLHVHLPGQSADNFFNLSTKLSRKFETPAHITLSTNYLSTPWLARILARSDCFVTASRGEGWGIPPMEAMAVGLPIIAPFHGGMKDFIDRSTVFELSGEIRSVHSIDSEFGLNFKKKYEDSNMLSYFEPSVDSLIEQFHKVASAANSDLVNRGAKGREHLLMNFGIERLSDQATFVMSEIKKTLF